MPGDHSDDSLAPLEQDKQSEDVKIGDSNGLTIEGNFSQKIARKPRRLKKTDFVSYSKPRRAKSQPQATGFNDKLPSLVVEPRSKLSVKDKHLKAGFCLPSLSLTKEVNPLSRPGSVDSRKSDPNIVTQCAIVDGLKDDNPKFQNAVKTVSTVATAGQAFARGIAAPSLRPRGKDISATVNGVRSFGLGKTGITRAVVHFSRPPVDHPFTLCFHFPSTFLTHLYVLDMIRTQLNFMPSSRVVSIQFIDRNTFHGAQSMDNRWLVTLNTVKARDELMLMGLRLYNRKINLRKYDDVLKEEYEEFLRYDEIKKRLQMKAEVEDFEEENDENDEDKVETPQDILRKFLAKIPKETFVKERKKPHPKKH